MASVIQRLYRGYFARKSIKPLQTERQQLYEKQLLNYLIVSVQRCFRGYHSRKFKFDFYERKKFIEDSLIRGIQLRSELVEYHAKCLQLKEEEEVKRRSEELRETAERLHHLLGTTQQRGVFNPPPESIPTPTINSVPVEVVLRNVIRDLLRSRGLRKGGHTISAACALVPDLHGSRRLPLRHVKSKLSVQASSKYDIDREEKCRENAITRIKMSAKGKYLAGGKTTIIDTNTATVAPLCTDDPFIDTYANPALMRGVPSSQTELKKSYYDRKPYFVKKLKHPFYARTDGNKSSVFPNDIFDIIADAEECGGAVQRHLGITMGTVARFGVPNTADNRNKGLHCA